MYCVVFPGNPTGSECKAKPRAYASNRSRRTFSSECMSNKFYFGSELLSISVHMFSGSRAARGRRLLDFREDASDCRSNFLSPPPFAPLCLHLSPSLFLVPHPAEELGNLHILETRAPASQSVSVCVFVRFRPPRILPAKEERTEKVVSDFARSVSFMVCSLCLSPFLPNLLRRLVHHSSAIMWAGFALRSQENRMLFDMGRTWKSWNSAGRRTCDVKFNFLLACAVHGTAY